MARNTRQRARFAAFQGPTTPQPGTIDDDKRTISVGPMNETLPSPWLPSGAHTTVGKQARVGRNLGETKKIRMEKWSGMAMQDGNGMKSNEFLS